MQLRLFEIVTHLEPDYFLSGDPDKPDPTEEEYLGWNWQERFAQAKPAEVIPLFTGHLVLCDPPEDGWRSAPNEVA